MPSLQEYKSTIDNARGARDALKKTIQTNKNHAQKLLDDLISTEEAQTFLQSVAFQTQNQLKIHIEDIVQLALDSCFPGEYKFEVLFEIKRGKTEASIGFIKEGELVDPMTASGGGAVDITAFALRLAAWTLSKNRNTIILDEPFRFLSANLQPKAAIIMKELSAKLNLQFICVTHNDNIVEVADRVFTVSLKKGISRVEV